MSITTRPHVPDDDTDNTITAVLSHLVTGRQAARMLSCSSEWIRILRARGILPVEQSEPSA